MNNQQIRPSQFITTYGPGSVLETRSGPVIIPSFDRVFVPLGLRIDDFEIHDTRLVRSPELNGAGIARVPTNAELGIEDQTPVYQSDAFPYWSLCTVHEILYQARNGCPQCGGSTFQIREKSGREAIRFVLACTNGHLDDVDWGHVIHAGPTCQPAPQYYIWKGGGSSLRNVRIECPNSRCGANVILGDAYNRDWKCSGRFPERGTRSTSPSCAARARILQRGAANLRVPEVVSALTIPPLTTKLTNILEDPRVLTVCRSLIRKNDLTTDNFVDAISNDVQPPLVASVLKTLVDTPWAELEPAIHDVVFIATNPGRPLKDEEFDSLRHAAEHGAPSIPSPQVGAPPQFEVLLSNVRQVSGPAGRIRFRVVPISRLRMVLVQRAYRRPVNSQDGAPVDVSFNSGTRSWYPGVELFGEGIYIDCDDADLQLGGANAQAWERSYQQCPTDVTLHPVHIWWHSLSHRLLRSLSVDSGYSSASIRERVYFGSTKQGVPIGGVLFYTVQPGGDGTLGGLISLVPNFQRVIVSAMSDVRTCSNDPLCDDTAPNGANGAACYSCLFTSETSCEERNMRLDRGLLVDNLP